MATLTETLMDLINASELSLKEISDRAGVPYQNFRRWVKGRRGKPGGRSNRTYDADSADAVYKVLTGNSYVEDVN